MAEVTVWRADTPQGETFSDEFVENHPKPEIRKYGTARNYAAALVANANYSYSPVSLNSDFGGTVPTATGNELTKAQQELSEAENTTLGLIGSFLADSKDFGLYGSTDADAVFVEEEQQYVPTAVEMKRIYPWLTDALVNILIDGEGGYVDTGNIDIALANMRASETYAKTFPGIARADGTLRMTESEYYETKDVMADALRTYNLNPEIFEEDITNAIAGDVSAKEFIGRLEFGYTNLVNNIPAVKEVYFREYGMDLSDEALFAMFISPNIAESVLQNQILVSSIIAEAETAGSSLTKEAGQIFAQGGVTQEEARQIYGQVQQLSGLIRVAGQAGITGFTETSIAQGLSGLNNEQLAIIRSLGARAASVSSPTTGAATTQTGEVTGLTEL